MALDSYSGLQTTIAQFLNREDLTAIIPTFIALAEADMDRQIRHWRMEARATTPIDTQYSELPSDWLATVRLSIGTDVLELVSQSVLMDLAGMNEGVAGKPHSYAITNGTLEVFPVPDASYTGEMVYFRRIEPLSDTQTSNWLLQDAPDAYLYGALVHSAPYLQEDARTTLWAGMHQNAISSLNLASKRARHSGTGLRVAPRKLI